ADHREIGVKLLYVLLDCVNEDLLLSEISFLTPHFKELTEFLTQTGYSTNMASGIRIQAFNYLFFALEYKKEAIRKHKHIQPLLATLTTHFSPASSIVKGLAQFMALKLTSADENENFDLLNERAAATDAAGALPPICGAATELPFDLEQIWNKSFL
ncbi:hypothetical protein CONCODRAFT_166918, partial [Conidiobolus coronatus NRRL 28638]